MTETEDLTECLFSTSPITAADTLKTKKSPLQLPETLGHVFKFLPFNHLKSCRLVSHFWNDCAIPIVRKGTRMIPFCDSKQMSAFVDCFSNKSNDGPPVANKIQLKLCYILQKPAQQIFQRMVCSVAPWITELSILYYINDFEYSIDSKLSPEFPSLQKLEIFLFSGENVDDERRQRAVQLLGIFMFNSANLRELSVICSGASSDGIVNNCIIQSKNSSRISTLKLRGNVTPSDMLALSQCDQLKLKAVHLNFMGCTTTVSENILQLFLKSQSETLQHLEITALLKTDTNTFQFPRLPNLSFLSLNGYQVAGRYKTMEVSFPNLNIKREFPFLKTIKMSKFGQDEWFRLFRHQFDVVESVNDIVLCCKINDPEKCKRLKEIFPMAHIKFS